MKLGILTVVGVALVGCSSNNLEATNHPAVPPPSQEQLANMPPQAAEHAKAMSDYAKAQAEQGKSRLAPNAGPR